MRLIDYRPITNTIRQFDWQLFLGVRLCHAVQHCRHVGKVGQFLTILLYPH